MRGEIIGSGAHSHDHTGDRTGGSYLGAGPHRMNCPPPDPPASGATFLFSVHGSDEQIFGADKQVPGRGQSD